MALIVDKTHHIFMGGGHEHDVQAWRTERLADESFEYHAFVGTNGLNGHKALWMIIRITDPNEINALQEYTMGYTGLEGDPDDTLTVAWAGRVGLTYVRYDKVISEFFNYAS